MAGWDVRTIRALLLIVQLVYSLFSTVLRLLTPLEIHHLSPLWVPLSLAPLSFLTPLSLFSYFLPPTLIPPSLLPLFSSFLLPYLIPPSLPHTSLSSLFLHLSSLSTSFLPYLIPSLSLPPFSQLKVPSPLKSNYFYGQRTYYASSEQGTWTGDSTYSTLHLTSFLSFFSPISFFFVNFFDFYAVRLVIIRTIFRYFFNLWWLKKRQIGCIFWYHHFFYCNFLHYHFLYYNFLFYYNFLCYYFYNYIGNHLTLPREEERWMKMTMMRRETMIIGRDVMWCEVMWVGWRRERDIREWNRRREMGQRDGGVGEGRKCRIERAGWRR